MTQVGSFYFQEEKSNDWYYFIGYIINGLSPPHLSELYTSYLSNNTRYEFRYPNIQNALARTETYRCSFFPSAIRTWNSLDSSVKNASK